jgi:aminoglycoside phosphotransferase family enzyme/predicted kinase
VSDISVDSTLIDSLRDPKVFGAGVSTVELIETHISWVLLAGEHAYKIKKPVKLPFLDFSTLDKRAHFCHEELRINRRLAPELYLAVVPIGGTPGAPKLGAEPAIEYAVEMLAFAPDATLERKIGAREVTAAAIRELAELIAAFHSAEEPVDGDLGDREALDNLTELADALGDADGAALAELRRWTEEQCRSLRDLLESRRAHGTFKEGHGDLHLGNLVLIDGRIVPFDALEFDRALRCIDVINEVGFLVMDLMAHGRNDLAFEFLNRYLERTGDYGGLRVLPFFLVYRALVRAKVNAIAAAQHPDARRARDAPPYLRLAVELIRPRQPLLVITYGLSGTGKTTVTDALIGSLPAVRIRSDLERKRLHGLDAHARSGSRVAQDMYSEQATERTYAALLEAADGALAANLNVIVDAAFLSRRRRDEFGALARRRDAAFVIVQLEAPNDVLRSRIEARARRAADASEADTAVLDYQLARCEPPADDERPHCVRVDTGGPVDYGALGAQIQARAT